MVPHLLPAAGQPQHSAHPGQQLPGVERFGDVIVGPQLQANNLVHILIFGGDDDDGDVYLFPTDGLADLEPVHIAGQHQIQQYQVGSIILDVGQCFLSRLHPGDRVPFPLQDCGDEGRDGVVVLYDQNLHTHCILPSPTPDYGSTF